MSTILLFRDYFQERESRMKIKRKIKLVFSIFLIVYFLTTGPFPVFAFEMKSNNYHLQLEPSDINAVEQDSWENLKKEKIVKTGNLLSDNNNNNLLKLIIVGLFFVFLIFFFVKLKNNLNIKKNKTKMGQ